MKTRLCLLASFAVTLVASFVGCGGESGTPGTGGKATGGTGGTGGTGAAGGTGSMTTSSSSSSSSSSGSTPMYDCTAASGAPGALKLTQIADSLNAPILVKSAPDDPDRLYIVQQSGEILIWENGAVLATPFL